MKYRLKIVLLGWKTLRDNFVGEVKKGKESDEAGSGYTPSGDHWLIFYNLRHCQSQEVS